MIQNVDQYNKVIKKRIMLLFVLLKYEAQHFLILASLSVNFVSGKPPGFEGGLVPKSANLFFVVVVP